MTLEKYRKLGLHYNFITGKFEYEDGTEVIEIVEKSRYYAKPFDTHCRVRKKIILYIKDITIHPRYGNKWIILPKRVLKDLVGRTYGN